ncbi:hypothetical protein VN97_g13218, partial [Penicillium thymicola]
MPNWACLLPDWERGHCLHCLPAEIQLLYQPLWISLCIFLFFSPSLLFSLNALFHSKTW